MDLLIQSLVLAFQLVFSRRICFLFFMPNIFVVVVFLLISAHIKKFSVSCMHVLLSVDQHIFLSLVLKKKKGFPYFMNSLESLTLFCREIFEFWTKPCCSYWRCADFHLNKKVNLVRIQNFQWLKSATSIILIYL